MKFTLGAALVLALAAAGASAAQTPPADQATTAPGKPDAAPAAPLSPTAPTAPAPPAAATPAPPEATPSAPAPAETTPAAAASAPAPSPGTSDAQPPVVANPAHGLIPGPAVGKGQVVFFRSSSFIGAGVWYTVKENGHKLGDLSNGAFFALPADPGVHVFTAATENKDTLRIEVEAGETYYVRGTVHMGVLVGEASLAPSDEDSFEKVFKHLHPAKTWPVEASAADTARTPTPDPKP